MTVPEVEPETDEEEALRELDEWMRRNDPDDEGEADASGT